MPGTKLCQAGGKRIDKWIANKQSKELLQAYSKLPRIRGSLILRAVEGKNGGSYYTMDIAIQIAQWIDPYFAVQVSSWTKELLLTGSVTLGKELSTQQLDLEWKNKYLAVQQDYEKLSLLHNSLKFKRSYENLQSKKDLKIYHL